MADDNLEKGIKETTSFTTGSGFCPNSKRTDYIDWSEFFMGIAILAAKRSKDPKTQVGACIVNKYNKIVGIGYNGMPLGCHDDVFPWTKSDDPLQSKHSYVCHAELNAVLNKNCSDVHGCTIYVGLFPCNECAKVIIQSGIKEIVFMSDKNDDKTKASKRMLVAAGVKYRMFHPKRQKIELDFSDPRSQLDNSITNLTIIDY